MRTNNDKPTGMCPNLTKPKKTVRKKPNPYKAPITIKRYYKGIEYGIQVLRDDLLNELPDTITKEELESLIKYRANRMVAASKQRLSLLEKRKTKEKIKEWEEKEWESL